MVINATGEEVKSNRGKEWVRFSAEVLHHIENYAVPQYGDLPNDTASQLSIQDVKAMLTKYISRIGSNARGKVEEVRDCLKIAHYACILHTKYTATAMKGIDLTDASISNRNRE